MTDLEILPAAQVEYENATDWYAEKSAAVAARFVSEVEAAIDAIHRHPDSYARWDETYRFYLLNKFPYYVAYRYTPESVVIVAIRHAARDQEAWQSRASD